MTRNADTPSVERALIKTLIVAALATFSTGCAPALNCGPAAGGELELDEELTEAEVAMMVEELGEGRELLTCESVCEWTDGMTRGLTIETCEFSIDPTPGEAPETVVGTIRCDGTATPFCEGRRPLGHVPAPARGPGLGEYLARCAHLEAAAVVAFTQLADQLERLGAPARLIARCRQARDEERVHAELVGALATEHGARVPRLETRPVDATLLGVALHNAREGCVHETWAATRAAWIAGHARGHGLRSVYRRLAVDEAAHAQLSWDLHRWFLSMLDASGRARVRGALCRELAKLPTIAASQAGVYPDALGMPSAVGCARLATLLRDELLEVADRRPGNSRVA